MRARPLRQVNATEALERVRKMRGQPTKAEALLWGCLRGRRLEGAKLRRQMWIGSYIADFACLDARLVVETDGGQHGDQVTCDQARDAALVAEGWRVLRFWNNDVVSNLGGVMEAIRLAIVAPSPSQAPLGPLPLPQGEG